MFALLKGQLWLQNLPLGRGNQTPQLLKFRDGRGNWRYAKPSLGPGQSNATTLEILRRPGQLAVGGCRLGAARHQQIDLWSSGNAKEVKSLPSLRRTACHDT
eukprot:s1962_g13.t1